MKRLLLVAALILLVSSLGFAGLGRIHAIKDRSAGPSVYGARGKAVTVDDGAPRVTSTDSPNLYLFVDNFDGANDTVALVARGYKVFYRGSTAQAAPAWFQGNPSVFVAYNGPTNGYVGSNWQTVTGTANIDNWLVLPALNVTTADSIRFYERAPLGTTYTDTIRVMYSAVGDSVPEAGSWVELGRFKADTGGVWIKRTFGPAIAGTTARYAIRYAVVNGGAGVNSDYIGIDAMTVGTPPVDDIQVASLLLSPASPNVGQVITISAIINNVGSGLNPTSLPMTYKIGSVPGSSGDGTAQTFVPTWTGSTDTVSFTTTYTPLSVGTLTIGVRSFYGSDLNSTNDSAKINATIYPTGTVVVGDFTNLTGWARTGPDTIWFIGTATQSNGSLGNAALADFYEALNGSIDTLISPSVDISAAGGKVLKFDHAYRNYSGTELDSVMVLVSSNSGTSWAELSRDGYPNMATLAQSGSFFVPNNATDWRNNSFIIPPGLPSATTKFAFVAMSDFGNNFCLDNVRVEPQASMAFSSGTATQNTLPILAGTAGHIIGMQVVTSGSGFPLTVTRFKLNANGTSNASDISNAKIYYTGTSNVFAEVNQFGLTFPSPTIAPYGVNGSQTLVEGTNYFWLTYDVAGGATVGNFADAEFDSVTVGGTNQRPAVTAPSGHRTIKTVLAGGSYTIGGPIFNSVLGREVTFQKNIRKVIREMSVETDNIGANNFTRDHASAASMTAGTATRQVEVEEVSWTMMDGGKPFQGRRRIEVTEADRVKYGLPNDVLAVYATITDALIDLNNLGVSGPVTFLLAAATYPSETYPLTVNVTAPGVPTSTNTVTFKPQTSVSPTISGAMASGPIFSVLNTNYVTIDGSNTVGGSTRDLTLQNTSTTSPLVVLFGSVGTTPITNDVVKNCTVLNGVNTSSAVVVSDGTTPGDPGYFTNVTVANNSVQTAYVGVYASAFVTPGNGNGLNILSNALDASGTGALRFIGVYVEGADGAVVRGNNVGNFNGTSNEIDRGVWLAQSTINSTVERNEIHNLNYSGTGGYGCDGIVVSSATSLCNNTLKNNFIYNLTGDGRNFRSALGGNPKGVYIFGTQSGVSIYNNSINLYGNTLNKDSALAIGVAIGTGSIADVQNNIISNNLGLSAALGYGSTGIYLESSATQLSASNRNDFNVNPSGGGAKSVGQIDVAASTTLAAWQTATGLEVNSVSGDPLYTATTNLHITGGGSPASNAGGSLAPVTDDFDGDTRNATTPDIGADEFTVSSTVNINTAIALGWNMIANPVTSPTPDDSAKHLFPTIISKAFFFGLAGYTPVDTMGNGIGYWGKFPALTTNSITGLPRTRDSISVRLGWNMVGSISNSVDTSTIVSVPPGIRVSNWFSFGAGYTATTPLVPGKAYWVKTSAAGKFVFANPVVSRPAKSEVAAPPLAASLLAASPLDALNTLTITDSKGGSQTLYFGADPPAGRAGATSIPVSMYVMPPLPPAGAMDARFASADGGTMVQTHAATVTGEVEFPVTLQSDAYPLTVRWKLGNGTASYELTDGLGGKAFRAKEMTSDGSVKIVSSEVSRITVKLVGDGSLPKEFSLSQNYPNPFNPSTTIKYGLPVDSRVTVDIYNIIGQRVRTLVSDNQAAGYHAAEWNGLNNEGKQLASGVYFLQMSAKGVNGPNGAGKSFHDIRKLMLMK